MLSVGDEIWIPCEVKPGPFSDERTVTVSSDKDGVWVGFVRTRFIENPSASESRVRCTVSEVHGDRFVARIPGNAAIGSAFMGWVQKATRLGRSFEA